MMQIRLKPLLFLLLFLLCSLLLLSVILLNYQIVSRIVTRELGGAKLELLYNYQSRIMSLVENTESSALNIAIHEKLREALESDYESDYQYYRMRTDLEDWLNGIVYADSRISSIRVYSDRFRRYPRIGNRLRPLDAVPWQAELGRLNDVNSIWIGAHPEYVPRDPSVRKQELTYVTQIYNRSGRVIGYVEINIEAALLQGVIRSGTGDVRDDQLFLLLDANGRLMTDLNPDQTGYSLDSGDRSRIVSLSQQLDTGLYRIELGGKPSLYINYPNKYFNWGIVEIVPFGDMFHALYELRHYVMLIGAGGLLLIFLLGSFLSERLIAPIRTLLTGFKHIETGNYASAPRRHFIFEFNQLHVGFGRMSERLNANIKDLHRQHAMIREAELRALQNQITPHFLYNTLDIINCMAAEHGIGEISLVANRLAHLFRIGLSKGQTFITLQEELEHALAYVDIQSIRFPDRFVYCEQVDDALKRCVVPKVILQPFIENAIKHGFSAGEKGSIVVRSRPAGPAKYQLVVEDDGRGLHGAAAMRPDGAAPGGYGTRNVDERISLYFGPLYGVELRSRAGRGTQVVITLPIVYSAKEGEAIHESTAG